MAEARGLALREPSAMTLATSAAEGPPHARVVLCKGWSNDGFLFFTNYLSRKGKDLAARPFATGVFFWDGLARQVTISGSVQKTSREVSANYWRTRPRDSQVGGWASKQSEVATSRAEMEQAWREAESRFGTGDIPCPDHWGGYCLQPRTIEFWIGRPGRFHDRHLFERTGSGWTYRRLFP